ncbi:MAG: LCP family protein [Chloroflexota bacterium]|nr:LCP family protein [Chloroflexota bacterium]
MRRQAQMARGDDTLPYDREFIRSGGTSSRSRRKQATFKPPPRERRRAPRRPGSFLRTLRTVLLLALVLVVVGGVLLGMRAVAFNATVTDTPFISASLLGPLNGSDRVNVMMVGYGGGDHDGAYLADSIQLLSIDPETDTTTTVPLPRDLWVEGVAAFPQNGKINETFSIGHLQNDSIDEGAQLLGDVVATVTGLEVDHWITIDFQGFQEMVDAVGGVTVDNPTPFCWTTIEEFHLAGRWEMGCFEQGQLQLDGETALQYARARYTSDVSESTDFARSVRQARIIAALRGTIGDGGLGAIVPGLRLMDAMEGRVRTDMSVIDLFLLSSHLSSDRRVELTEGPVLTATTNTIGQYILIPTGWTGPGDYGTIRAYLETELSQPVSAPGSDAPQP